MNTPASRDDVCGTDDALALVPLGLNTAVHCERAFAAMGLGRLPLWLTAKLEEEDRQLFARALACLLAHLSSGKRLDRQILWAASDAANRRVPGSWPCPPAISVSNGDLSAPAAWAVSALCDCFWSRVETPGTTTPPLRQAYQAAHDEMSAASDVLNATLGSLYSPAPLPRQSDLQRAWHRIKDALATFGPVLLLPTVALPPVPPCPPVGGSVLRVVETTDDDKAFHP